jgi:hypothetical protein
MEHLRIEQPCKETWSEMNATDKGAFCNKCNTEVIDFSDMTTNEIKQEFKKLSGNHFCSRFKKDQLSELNNDFVQWQTSQPRSFQSMMLFSMILVFGLGLFSCSNEQHSETITSMQKEAVKMISGEKKTETDSLIPQEMLNVETEVAPEVIGCAIQYTRCNIGEELVAVTSEQKEEMEYYILGMPAMTTVYREYIEELPEVVPEYDENGLEIPKVPIALAYPNPASLSTNLKVGIPSTVEQASINLFNMNGQLIRSIHNGNLRRGTSLFEIDLIDLQPGMYLITILSKEYSETIRISKM